MRKLDNITLLDLLPPNFKQDPHSIALSAALKAAFIVAYKDSDVVLLYPVIDQLQDAPLDKLAPQWAVQGYKDSLPLENKRRLIKRGLTAQLYAGTAKVVQDKIADALGDDALIREWHQYGGDPYLFAVDLETEHGMDMTRLANVNELISDVKNTRSHLDYLAVTLAAYGTTRIACFTIGECETKIEPMPPKPVDVWTNVRAQSYAHMWQKITIEPLTNTELDSNAQIYATSGLAMRQVITIG